MKSLKKGGEYMSAGSGDKANAYLLFLILILLLLSEDILTSIKKIFSIRGYEEKESIQNKKKGG